MLVFLLGLIAPLTVLVGGVIVDDTSQLISYSNTPSWAVGNPSQLTSLIQWAGNNEGSAYGETWHEADSMGSKLTFRFTGTAISVVGIVTKYWTTKMSFSIDGGDESFYNNVATATTRNVDALMYGVQVFSTSGLSPSSHTLVLQGYPTSFVFGLDYIEYAPVDVAAVPSQSGDGAQTATPGTTSQTSSSSSTSPTSGFRASGTSTSNSLLSTLPAISISAGSDLTNDRPTIPPSDSRIVYAEQWNSSTSCDLSSRVTSTIGATFAFNFTGPDIWVYTATDQRGAKYKVSINGTDMGVVETAGPTCKIEASFHMGNLDKSNHTLIFTSLGSSSSSDGEINFIGLRLSSSVDQATGDALSQDGGANKAAIAGGVTGGVAALLLLSFVFYMRLRRQRQEKSLRPTPAIENTESITPAILPSRSEGVPLNEKQQLRAAERALNIDYNPPAYHPHAKPPLPEWAIRPSHDSSGENLSIYRAESSSSRHQSLAVSAAGMGHVYQVYKKPPVPTWATDEGSGENIGSHHHEAATSQQQLLLDSTASTGNVYQAYTKPSFPEWATRPSHDNSEENTSIYHAEATTSQQQLLANNTASTEDVYRSYTKPPVPTWANNGTSRENISSHYDEVVISHRQLPAANTARTGHVYQSYTKPPVPTWANNERLEENSNLHHDEREMAQQQQQQHTRLPSLPPPSFRTRPLSRPNSLGHAHDAHSIHSTTPLRIDPNANSQTLGHSAENGASRTGYDDEELLSAPPYVEDVLARPDARNLSETDVDTIARRLAEVMRIQRRARGGPGLLRERAAPPRELLDRLVEEHLGQREDAT